MYNTSLVLAIMVLAGAVGGLVSIIMTKREFPAEPNLGPIPAFFNKHQGISLLVLGALAGSLVPLVLSFVAPGLGMQSVTERIFVAEKCGDHRKLLELYDADVKDGVLDKDKFVQAVVATDFDSNSAPECGQEREFNDLMLLWGISLLAGFMAWQAIPNMANRIDNRLSNLKVWEQELAKRAAAIEAAGGQNGGGPQGGGGGQDGGGGGNVKVDTVSKDAAVKALSQMPSPFKKMDDK